MTNELPTPWIATPPTEPQAALTRKLDSLKAIVAANFPRRHEFPHGSQQRERCWTIIRAAIRGCRSLTDPAPASIEADTPPTDYRAMLAQQIETAEAPLPFLTRQMMAADFALSLLCDVERSLSMSDEAAPGTLAAVTAALQATAKAVQTIRTAAPELPASHRGAGYTRAEFDHGPAEDVRLTFYRDDRVSGRLVLPATLTVAEAVRITDGVMGASIGTA